MALPLRNTFETGLADETTVDTANSGDGSAGNAFDNVTIIGATTLVYDTAQAAHGALSARITHSGTDGAFMAWDVSMGSQTTIYGRLYIYRTANPTPGQIWLVQPALVGVTNALVRMKSDGTIDVFDSTLVSAIGMTTPITLNAWMRIEWKLVCNASTGIIEAKMFSGDSTTAIDTATFTNANTLTAVDSVLIGQSAAIDVGSSTWLDDIVINNAGYPGPVPASNYAAEVLIDDPVAYYRMDETEFTTTASDDYNRANENPLVTNWTTITGLGDMKLASNSVTNVTNDTFNDGAIYDAITFPDNQWSAADLSVTCTAGVRRGPALHVRCSAAADTSYRLSVDHAASTNCNISRFIAGSRTTILDFTQAWTDGDEWKLAVDGPASAARLRVYLNGTLIQTVVDNSSIASGYPGIGVSDNVEVLNVLIDNWSGGAVNLPQDSSGNGNHTTIIGGTPAYSQTGSIGSDPTDTAISFDGATEYFTAPDHATLDIGDIFTLEAWAKRGSVGAVEHCIMAKANDGSNAGPGMYFSSDFLTLAKAGIVPIVQSSVTITDTTTWHHVVATKNGSTVHLYLDGVDVTDLGSFSNATCTNNSQPLGIGLERDAGGDGSFMDGILDEIAMYPTALTQARVLAHYNAALAAVQTEPTIVSTIALMRSGRW